MKCDELKAYNVVATADVNPEVVDSLGCTEWTGYDKYEVDAAIAELKQKLAEEREFGLNRAKSADHEIGKLCAELCELKAENRKAKRALWLARAMRNKDLRTLGNFRKYVESLTKTKLSMYHYPKKGFPSTQLHKYMIDSFETWCKYLKIAEDKCLKKAEEYK